ncbi:hypothetical protein K438DRAFT_1952452 [Mycena galopus ATCC 62051]|nr:hypothetical protein K438DRAFT_1952452 [Mycena galopus ATCC 62051]
MRRPAAPRTPLPTDALSRLRSGDRTAYAPLVFTPPPSSPSSSTSDVSTQSRLDSLLSPPAPTKCFPAEAQGVPWDVDEGWEECPAGYEYGCRRLSRVSPFSSSSSPVRTFPPLEPAPTPAHRTQAGTRRLLRTPPLLFMCALGLGNNYCGSCASPCAEYHAPASPSPSRASHCYQPTPVSYPDYNQEERYYKQEQSTPALRSRWSSTLSSVLHASAYAHRHHLRSRVPRPKTLSPSKTAASSAYQAKQKETERKPCPMGTILAPTPPTPKRTGPKGRNGKRLMTTDVLVIAPPLPPASLPGALATASTALSLEGVRGPNSASATPYSATAQWAAYPASAAPALPTSCGNSAGTSAPQTPSPALYAAYGARDAASNASTRSNTSGWSHSAASSVSPSSFVPPFPSNSPRVAVMSEGRIRRKPDSSGVAALLHTRRPSLNSLPIINHSH